MANFTDILNKPADTIERPKPTPVGTYLSIVNGPHKQREINDKPVVDLVYKTMQAQGDVDQADLAAAGGVGKFVTHSFWLVDNEGNISDWPLKNHLETRLGIDPAGKSLAQMLSEAPGKQLLVSVKHEPYTDKNNEQQIAIRVGGTAKV